MEETVLISVDYSILIYLKVNKTLRVSKIACAYFGKSRMAEISFIPHSFLDLVNDLILLIMERSCP